MLLSTDNCPECGGEEWVPAHRLPAGVRECDCKLDALSPRPRRVVAPVVVAALVVAFAALLPVLVIVTWP